MPLKERRTIVKKDEKDAGSRRWNALMSLASFELGFLALNLRSRDCSWRVDYQRGSLRLRFRRLPVFVGDLTEGTALLDGHGFARRLGLRRAQLLAKGMIVGINRRLVQ